MFCWFLSFSVIRSWSSIFVISVNVKIVLSLLCTFSVPCMHVISITGTVYSSFPLWTTLSIVPEGTTFSVIPKGTSLPVISVGNTLFVVPIGTSFSISPIGTVYHFPWRDSCLSSPKGNLTSTVLINFQYSRYRCIFIQFSMLMDRHTSLVVIDTLLYNYLYFWFYWGLSWWHSWK